MKLWILRPRNDRPDKGERGEDPWEPWYDKSFGHVVAAPDEEAARELANERGGDETGEIVHTVYRTGGDPWLDPRYASCEELSADDFEEPTHILRDFSSA